MRRELRNQVMFGTGMPKAAQCNKTAEPTSRFTSDGGKLTNEGFTVTHRHMTSHINHSQQQATSPLDSSQYVTVLTAQQCTSTLHRHHGVQWYIKLFCGAMSTSYTVVKTAALKYNGTILPVERNICRRPMHICLLKYTQRVK